MVQKNLRALHKANEVPSCGTWYSKLDRLRKDYLRATVKLDECVTTACRYKIEGGVYGGGRKV